MATLELTQLAEHLEPDEIEAVHRALRETGSAPLDEDEQAEPVLLDRAIDDDIFVDFADRLEANEASADVYLPSDFEDIIEVADYKIGSAHALLLVLESLREDFFVEDEDEEQEQAEVVDEEFESFDEDEDEPGGMFGDDEPGTEMKDEQLRHIWKQMHRGAKLAIRQGLCMFIRD